MIIINYYIINYVILITKILTYIYIYKYLNFQINRLPNFIFKNLFYIIFLFIKKELPFIIICKKFI